MNLLRVTYEGLADGRIPCSCAVGEAVRESLAIDTLGHHYGWWLGELVCFVLYAQKKLFLHSVGALYCFLGIVTGSFERHGFLSTGDSLLTLALDIPRLLLALWMVGKVHALGAMLVRSCCGYRDDWGMGARLALLRQADHQLLSKLGSETESTKEALRTLIRVARKSEHDRLFEVVLISPRYVWNGWPFGRIRNGKTGKLFLLVAWAVYLVPFALRLALVTVSLLSGADACGPDADPLHRLVAGAAAFCVLLYCLVVVPVQVDSLTHENSWR